MSTADLAQPLRDAIIGDSGITSLLPSYDGSFTVFTNVPVPNNAPYPMIVISPDIVVLNADGINDFQPIPTRTISTYAANDTPANYRLADQLAYLVRDLFHRERQAIVVPGWHVIDIQAMGPEPVPSEDQTVGRMVTLAIRLAQLRS
jgi:hypothetical protein